MNAIQLIKPVRKSYINDVAEDLFGKPLKSLTKSEYFELVMIMNQRILNDYQETGMTDIQTTISYAMDTLLLGHLPLFTVLPLFLIGAILILAAYEGDA